MLSHARDCFAEFGYHGASMREIARRADVTATVLYDHFASKQALHLELLEREGAELIAAVAGPFDARAAREFMQASVDAFFSFIFEHRLTWRLLFAEAYGDPEVAALQESLFTQATETLTAMFALTPRWELSQVNDQKLTTQMLAALTRSALGGLAGWWWRHPDVAKAQVVSTAMDLLWRGVGGLIATGPGSRPGARRRGRT